MGDPTNWPTGTGNTYPEYAPGPWRSNEERLCSQALAVANVPGEVLQRTVRPPLPQIQLFRPRFGYTTTALTIDDVVNVDRYFPANSYALSGGVAGYQASARNVSATYGSM